MTSIPISAEWFWSQVEKGARCWIWKGPIFRNGYGRLRIWSGGREHNFLAHRVAWELAHGPIPKGLNVCHHCDTPACVRNDLCLFLGTQKENMMDMARKGRHPGPGRRGEQVNTAKLTEAQLPEVHRRYAAGETQAEIGASLGVAGPTISGVLRGTTWGGEKFVTPKHWTKGGRVQLPRAKRVTGVVVTEPVVYEPNPRPLAVPHELAPGEAERFWKKVAPPNENGCRLWLASCDNHGYGQVGVPSLQRVAKAHSVAWRLTYGPIPTGKQLNHSCDVRPCVEPAHLKLGTQKQNLQDISARGRWKPHAAGGENNATAKLTWEKVREIRRLRTEFGWKLVDLAKKFKLCTSQVSNIINHRQWIE